MRVNRLTAAHSAGCRALPPAKAKLPYSWRKTHIMRIVEGAFMSAHSCVSNSRGLSDSSFDVQSRQTCIGAPTRAALYPRTSKNTRRQPGGAPANRVAPRECRPRYEMLPNTAWPMQLYTPSCIRHLRLEPIYVVVIIPLHTAVNACRYVRVGVARSQRSLRLTKALVKQCIQGGKFS